MDYYLDDPAFSPDPRAHPYFHAPPKSTLPVPQVLSKNLKPHSTRKARMKAFVRRLTARHHLDRIDELDETDPFGASYHHDGPYEAILAQPRNHPPRKTPVHYPKRESDPRPLRPSQHQVNPIAHHHTHLHTQLQSVYTTPSTGAESGLSLHLEPGQILQPNSIYGSHLSSIMETPDQFLPLSTAPVIAKTNPSRRQSLPNSRTRHHQDFSSQNSFQSRQSSSLRAPRERYFGDYAPHVPDGIPPHHDAPPYTHHQPRQTVFPPPRYESRLHTSDPSPSLQHTSPPSLSPTSPHSHSSENTVPAPRHDTRHRTAHSLDGSHAFTRSSNGIQNKPLDPPRIRHLPKRLVMPAPLQPQQPQSYHSHSFPSAEPTSRQNEYSDDHALEGAHFEGKPAMYSQESKLLRKKSSAFPAKIPIPDHAPPISQDDTVAVMGNSSTKATNEAEGTKERTRRRRLSKRKCDI